jgi:hypothetical protein
MCHHTPKVWFSVAECDFETYECDLHSHEYDFETHKSDHDTHECDLYTQSVIFCVEVCDLQKKSVIFTRKNVILTRISVICTQRVWLIQVKWDFDTYKCDFFSQSMISTRNVLFIYVGCGLQLQSVILTRTSVIYTLMSMILKRENVIMT